MMQRASINLNGVPYTFQIWKQEQGKSCGPAAVITLLSLIGQRTPNEAIVRLWFGKVDEQFARSGVTSPEAADKRVFNFDAGAKGGTVRDVLKGKSGINARFTGEAGISLKQGMAGCSLTHPGIAWVKWANSRGHFFVTPGKIGNVHVYLDPWFGLVTNPETKFPIYSSHGGSFNLGSRKGTVESLCVTF